MMPATSVRAVGRNVRRKSHGGGQFVSVRAMALWLNAPCGWEANLRRWTARDGRAAAWRRFRPFAREYGAWRAAQVVLVPSLPLAEGQPLSSVSVRRFNRFATVCPVELHVTESALAPRATFAGFRYGDPRGSIVERLWTLFGDRHRERLKRCERCEIIWFADETKNRRRKFCSSRCRDRAWDRARRRQENHKQYQRKEESRRIGRRRRSRRGR